MVDGYFLQLLGRQVITEQTVLQGGNPEGTGLVRTEGDDVLVPERLGQVLVGTELTVSLIRDMVALVGSPEPKVPVTVAEDSPYFGIRNREGKITMVLEQDGFMGPVGTVFQVLSRAPFSPEPVVYDKRIHSL